MEENSYLSLFPSPRHPFTRPRRGSDSPPGLVDAHLTHPVVFSGDTFETTLELRGLSHHCPVSEPHLSTGRQSWSRVVDKGISSAWEGKGLPSDPARGRGTGTDTDSGSSGVESPRSGFSTKKRSGTPLKHWHLWELVRPVRPSFNSRGSVSTQGALHSGPTALSHDGKIIEEGRGERRSNKVRDRSHRRGGGGGREPEGEEEERRDSGTGVCGSDPVGSQWCTRCRDPQRSVPGGLQESPPDSEPDIVVMGGRRRGKVSGETVFGEDPGRFGRVNGLCDLSSGRSHSLDGLLKVGEPPPPPTVDRYRRHASSTSTPEPKCSPRSVQSQVGPPHDVQGYSLGPHVGPRQRGPNRPLCRREVCTLSVSSSVLKGECRFGSSETHGP